MDVRRCQCDNILSMLVYPASFAASSSLGDTQVGCNAIRSIQESRIGLDSPQATINGVPFITILDFSIELQDIARIDPVVSVTKILNSVNKFVRNTYKNKKDSRDALRWIMSQDNRMGVWCISQVAREALKYVPEGEMRPLRAIESAEGWVRGRVSVQDVKKASDAAMAYAQRSFAASEQAANASAYASAVAAYAGEGNYSSAVFYLAYAYDYTAGAISYFSSYPDRNHRHLTNTVLDAIKSFPV